MNTAVQTLHATSAVFRAVACNGSAVFISAISLIHIFYGQKPFQQQIPHPINAR